MDKTQIKGRWKQIQGEAKIRWGKLTDDDWKVAEGDIDKLAGRIQERYGHTKEVVSEQLGKLVSGIRDAVNKKK